MPQPVYEMLDLQNRRIECQFYMYELVVVTVSTQREFKIAKLVRTANKGGVRQNIVKWGGYAETFIT